MVEGEPLNISSTDTAGEKPLRIRRGKVDAVDLYEIKDSELDLLERGTPTDLYLNFSIFLLSVAFSAIIALCTTTGFKYEIMQLLLLVISVVGLLLGVLLLIMWYRGRRDITEVIAEIRNRISPDPIIEAPEIAVEAEEEDDAALPPEPKG